jgi:hypothetical protein
MFGSLLGLNAIPNAPNPDWSFFWNPKLAQSTALNADLFVTRQILKHN